MTPGRLALSPPQRGVPRWSGDASWRRRLSRVESLIPPHRRATSSSSRACGVADLADLVACELGRRRPWARTADWDRIRLSRGLTPTPRSLVPGFLAAHSGRRAARSPASPRTSLPASPRSTGPPIPCITRKATTGITPQSSQGWAGTLGSPGRRPRPCSRRPPRHDAHRRDHRALCHHHDLQPEGLRLLKNLDAGRRPAAVRRVSLAFG